MMLAARSSASILKESLNKADEESAIMKDSYYLDFIQEIHELNPQKFQHHPT